MVIICDKKYNSLHLTRKKLTYHSTCIFWHYNYRNYWIFNCRYCISNVLIGSPNSSYQLMFQVTWYGITELMQRPKKRLLFKFYIVTSCIFFRISSPCFSTSATWISSRANLTAHITSCICYKMITLNVSYLNLLLHEGSSAKRGKSIFVTLLTEGQRGQDSGTPFEFDESALTNLRSTS